MAVFKGIYQSFCFFNGLHILRHHLQLTGLTNKVPFSVEGSPELTYRKLGDFLGGPVLRTLPSNAGDLVSITGLGTEVPYPVCFHLCPPGLPPREFFLWVEVGRVADGASKQMPPSGCRSPGPQTPAKSLTLWGPCSEVSVSRTPRCTSSSWNNLWLGPISPLSRTSFMTRFCISFWGVC